VSVSWESGREDQSHRLCGCCGDGRGSVHRMRRTWFEGLAITFMADSKCTFRGEYNIQNLVARQYSYDVEVVRFPAPCSSFAIHLGMDQRPKSQNETGID